MWIITLKDEHFTCHHSGPYECEDLEGYGVDGAHPVHIGDRFSDRYTIVHELDYGGNATEWLGVKPSREQVCSLKDPDGRFIKVQAGAQCISAFAIET